MNRAIPPSAEQTPMIASRRESLELAEEPEGLVVELDPSEIGLDTDVILKDASIRWAS